MDQNNHETASVIDTTATGSNKKRHGCLAAWLIFMIILNSIFSLVYVFGSALIRESYPTAPGWVFGVLTLSCIFNLACSIALYKWKKWGFWGFAVTTIIGFWLNEMLGVGIVQKILGFGGICMLYGVLQIGKANKGWPQLD
jgi:hypothetical protein